MAKGDTAKRAKKMQDYYWEHRDEILKKQKEQRSTPEYKARMKAYYSKNKQLILQNQYERRKAQRILKQIENSKKNNWRNGKLAPKDKACFICGSTETEKLISHHPDYDIPTLRVTLCYGCHQRVHKGKYNLLVESKKCSACGLYSYRVTLDPKSLVDLSVLANLDKLNGKA